MAATTGQPAHVSGQSQHGLIAGDQYAPVQLQEQPVDTPVVAEVSATPPNSKLKLTIIAVIAIVIIVAVVILVARIEFEDTWTQDPNYGEGWGDCGCFMDNSTFYPEWDEVCGDKPKNDVIERECVDECLSIYELYDIYSIYYVGETGECYCKTYENREQCLDTSNYTDIHVWEQVCCVYGRSYNIESKADLKSDIKSMDCGDYHYFADNEWIEFVSNNNLSDSVMMNQWLKQGLSEHASIATFAKFSLQLMGIGAPLWILKLSNEAGLDEIRHTQLSFDIANMYNNDDGECVVYNEFPEHVLNIDRDWNEISKDTAIGGCIGETISALKMIKKKYGNIIDRFVNQMAMDEIRHAALAWISVKWMIDNAPDDVGIDIANRDWWRMQIQNVDASYQKVIHGVLNKIFVNRKDYQGLYEEIVNDLQKWMNAGYNSQCAF